MKTNNQHIICVILAVLFILSFASFCISAKPTYTITDITHDIRLNVGDYDFAGDPVSINNSGQIISNHSYSNGYYERAFLWQNGIVTDLGTLDGFNGSTATSINDSGQIVGRSDVDREISHAFLWQNGVMTDLGTINGCNRSEATSINNSGQIVGFLRNYPDLPCCNGTFIWQNGLMTNLDIVACFSWSFCITNSGQIVGQCNFGNEMNTFIWQNGIITYISGFYFEGINDSGQIVGYNVFPSGDYSYSIEALLWQDGIMTTLKNLVGPKLTLHVTLIILGK